MKTATQKLGAFETVTNELLALMKDANLPIWKPGYLLLSHKNGATNLRYQGVNTMLLGVYSLVKKFKSSTWLTFNQVSKLGGRVKKGAKSFPIVYYFVTNAAEVEESKKFMLANPGFLSSVGPKLMPKVHRVFNLDDTEGLELEALENNQDKTSVQEIEVLLSKHENLPRIEHILNVQPAYRPTSDVVRMPILTQYKSSDNYFADLFHELGHSTGHESRLNRETVIDKTVKFGDADYSLEELIAEFTACFCCSHFNVKPEIEQNAAYLKGWFAFLGDNPELLLIAIQKANKAAAFILGT